MPSDCRFLVFQLPVRHETGLAHRRTDGYGAAAIARVWMDT